MESTNQQESHTTTQDNEIKTEEPHSLAQFNSEQNAHFQEHSHKRHEEEKPIGQLTKEEAKAQCLLCNDKSILCCPEHCCNWDTCTCSDCEYCRANKTKFKEENKYEQHNDPKILIKSTGQEEITKLNTKRQKSNTYKKKEKSNKKGEDENSEDSDEIKPQHKIKTGDGSLITNFEVDMEEEEIVYFGGVKGIRALKQQRDQMPDQQIPEEPIIESQQEQITTTIEDQQQQQEESKN